MNPATAHAAAEPARVEFLAPWRALPPDYPEVGEVWTFDGTTLEVIGWEPFDDDPACGRFRVRVQNGRFQGWRTESAWRGWTSIATRVHQECARPTESKEEC